MSFALLAIQAREKAGMPETWDAYRWKCMPNGAETIYYEVEGAITPLGVRTGRPNYRKMDKTSVRTVYITVAEHEAWRAAWGERTGNCLNCEGRGRLFRSWHHINGTTYSPCIQCNETGRADGQGPPKTHEAPQMELVLT